MIDLHCHILPGIDDGARDLDDALAMARQAEGDGITVVCATPHVRDDHDVRIHELDERIAVLQAALDAHAIAVRIARGGEVAAPIVDELDDAELATLAIGGRWILLEPAAGPLDEALLGAIDGLRARGFGSLVAHPERHASGDLEAVLRAAVSRGALVQATAAALADSGNGATWLLRLAGDGLINVVGSDAHSSHAGRRVELSAAYTALETAGGDARRMQITAGEVLAGGLAS